MNWGRELTGHAKLLHPSFTEELTSTQAFLCQLALTAGLLEKCIHN